MSLPFRRAGLTGALTVLVLAGASLVGAPLAATADESPAPVAPDERVVMGDFSPELYAEQAAVTPTELATAIQNDLGLTPAEYYAQADAAATAVDVVDELTAAGTTVLGSRVDGTELVVNVASDADAAAVESLGATAEFGAPVAAASRDVIEATPDTAFLGDLVGGQGFYSPDDAGGGWLCSTGFNGRDRSNNSNLFLTAGHCYVPDSSWDGTVFELQQSGPGVDPTGGAILGEPIPGSAHLGNGYDASLFSTYPSWTSKPSVGTWNNNQGTVTSGSPVPVRDYTKAIVGQSICKSGRTTGWTCGVVGAVDEVYSIGGTLVNSFTSNMCSLSGDSGGAVLSGNYAVGIVSFGNYQNSCWDLGSITGAFPIDSNYESVLGAEPNYELLVDVPKPSSATLGGGAPVYQGGNATGTVPGGSTRFTVHLAIDGGAQVDVPVASNGSWTTTATSGLANGPHTFSMFATYGQTGQQSATVSGSFVVADRPAVDRISGATRFDVAVEIANRMYPDTAPVVYVATGYNYPDALSAGPAAVKQGGPLLLTLTDGVPDVVAAKITSLSPERIVVVGGPNSVNESVLSTLRTLVPDAAIERISGADRYAASRAVVESVFSTAPHAYVATGGNFPDALSAGGAAGSKDEPVVLVNGGAGSADAPTLSLFTKLQTTSLTVVGGVNSVAESVKNSLASGIPATLDRVAGADRYQASISLNRSAFTTADTIYLATGSNFPDALAGGVLAGKTDAPLYVVPGDCVPRGVLADAAAFGATKIVLLGGPNSLSPAVQNLTACAW